MIGEVQGPHGTFRMGTQPDLVRDESQERFTSGSDAWAQSRNGQAKEGRRRGQSPKQREIAWAKAPPWERGWSSIWQLQIFTWLDIKRDKSDSSQERWSRIKLQWVIRKSLQDGMLMVFCTENWYNHVLKWFPFQDVLKDHFDLPVENRFDGSKTEGKETYFKVVGETHVRDGGAINELSCSERARKETDWDVFKRWKSRI